MSNLYEWVAGHPLKEDSDLREELNNLFWNYGVDFVGTKAEAKVYQVFDGDKRLPDIKAYRFGMKGFEGYEECKHYEIDELLTKLSTFDPNQIIAMPIIGEDEDEFTVQFAKDGRIEYVSPITTYVNPFDGSTFTLK